MSIALGLAAIGFLGVAYLVVEYSFLVPAPRGLLVLMYHRAAEHHADGLTIPQSMLDRHFAYLVRKGYRSIGVRDLIGSTDGRLALPPRPVLITFDDGFADFHEFVFPLLRKHGLRATVFIVAGRIGLTNTWDQRDEKLLDVTQMREMAASGIVEFGLHSFDHTDYNRLTCEEIREDIRKCREILDGLGIAYVPALAYPYGAFPRDRERSAAMRATLGEAGIELAFRIGQRVNPIPLRDRFEIKRAQMSGNDTFLDFTIKIAKGRRKLFA